MGALAKTIGGEGGGGPAVGVDVPGVSGETLEYGQPVVWDDDHTLSGTARVYLSDADGTDQVKDCGGLCVQGCASKQPTTVRTCGEVRVPAKHWDTALPGAVDVGKRVYISANVGKLTITQPANPGDLVMRVGWITRRDGVNGFAWVSVGLGEGSIVPGP